MLSTSDMAAMLRLYRDLLGGVETYRFPDADDAGFVVLRLGESEVGIALMTSNEGLIHKQPLRPAGGHRIELCVYVEDVDETVGQLRRADVEIVTEPLDQPWGERVAYVADPEGNLLMLTQGEG